MWCEIWCNMIWKGIFDMIWLDRIYMILDVIWLDRIYDKIWWYDMMWYDMIWSDMMWCDVWYEIWYHMLWYVIWYDMTWHVIEWYDMMWCDMIWYDIWYDMIWLWLWYMIYNIWYDMIYDMMRYDKIRYDTIRWDTIQNRSALCSLVINIKANGSHWLLSVIHFFEKGHCDLRDGYHLNVFLWLSSTQCHQFLWMEASGNRNEVLYLIHKCHASTYLLHAGFARTQSLNHLIWYWKHWKTFKIANVCGVICGGCQPSRIRRY